MDEETRKITDNGHTGLYIINLANTQRCLQNIKFLFFNFLKMFIFEREKDRV